MNGEVCVVTGAGSGIGQQLCIELARRGAIVVAAARDEARAADAAKAVLAAVPTGKVEPLACDVSSIQSMKAAAKHLLARHPKISLLVNNAAVFNKQRRTTQDGLELGYAVNSLAPYLMSTLLLPALKAAPSSRIVNMTMAPTNPLDFDDLQLAKKYNALDALKSTKSGHQYLTYALAKKLEGTRVKVLTVNPGLTQSKLPSEAPLPLRLVFKLFGKTPANGAKVPLSVCLDDKYASGSFVSDKGALSPMPAFIDATSSQRYLDVNARIAGV